MRVFLRLVREGLGRIIVFFDHVTRPEPMQRAPEEQSRIEDELETMSLYQFYACPFCVKVRRAAHRLNLPLELRDARDHSEHREQLKKGGGKVKVPCLRIDRDERTEWMYESDDIIQFLEDRFGRKSDS